ncbi:patched domain-containing protein [Anaeramoeba flamelloides]|uniref:Patched domain-containing protein n=1 Tax=Anaeramoeba flamelloides TaxID=1746091 RepID=A0ABQ8YJ06_9EUKA|nr:patched domain-containing protein [Anaeramoeba flamelloides]
MKVLQRWLIVCQKIEDFLSFLVGKIAAKVYDHIKLTIIASLIMTIAFGYGVTQTLEDSDIRRLYVPQDSQLMRDENYWIKKWGSILPVETVFITSDPIGKNIIHEDPISQFFSIHKEVVRIKIEYNGKIYGLEDLCKRHPLTNKCVIAGILDYWNWNETYYTNNPLQQIKKGVNIENGLQVFPSMSYVGQNYNSNNEIISAPELKMLDFLLEYKNTEMKKVSPKSTLTPYLSNSLNNEIEKSTGSDIQSVAIGYTIMMVVLCFSLGEIPSKFRTHPILSPLGILSTGMGIISGFGLGGYTVTTCSIVTILTFLVLAIGVDNLYIIVKNFDLSDLSDPPRDRVIKAMEKSTSIFLSTITTISVFIIGTTTPFLAIKYFCIYGTYCMIFVIINQITLFVAFLSIEAKRIASKRHPIFFYKYKNLKQSENPKVENESILQDEENVDILETNTIITFSSKNKSDDHSFKIDDLVVSNQDKINVSNGIDDLNNNDNQDNTELIGDVYQEDNINENSDHSDPSDPEIGIDTKNENSKKMVYDNSQNNILRNKKQRKKGKEIKKEKKLHLNKIQIFIQNKFCSFILNKKIRIIILILFSILFIVSIIFAVRVESGFDEAMVIPDDSYMKETIHLLRYYVQKKGPVFYLVIKEGTNYYDGNVKNELIKLIQNVENSGWVREKRVTSWYRDFIDYAKLQNSSAHLENGWPKSEEHFWEFLTTDFLQQPQYMAYNFDEHILLDPTAEKLSDKIIVSRFIYRALDILKVRNRIDYMLKLRDITTESPINCFIWNNLLFLVEQYIIIVPQTLTNIALSIFIVGCFTFFFLGHPKLLIIIIIVMVNIITNLFAFIYLYDLTIDAITMISLIMSVGFSIDYSAHVCHAYVTRSAKTREGRTIRALTEIGSSVFLGGITTFIGLLPVVFFANSDLFRVIVSLIYATIVLGLINCVFLLPVLLSMIGPNKFLEEYEKMDSKNENENQEDNDSKNQLAGLKKKSKPYPGLINQKDIDVDQLDFSLEITGSDSSQSNDKKKTFSQWMLSSSGSSNYEISNTNLAAKKNSSKKWLTASSLDSSDINALQFPYEIVKKN